MKLKPCLYWAMVLLIGAAVMGLVCWLGFFLFFIAIRSPALGVLAVLVGAVFIGKTFIEAFGKEGR